MNETLKRTISGAVYVILLLSAILFSAESFFVLFGLFLLIAIFEFSNLVKVNKLFALVLGAVCYTSFVLLSNYNQLTSKTFNVIFKSNFDFTLNIQLLEFLLLILAISATIKCLFFLFSEKKEQFSLFLKYFYLLGYLIVPFIIITKISFGVHDYNPKIIIGLFILIWTNDSFAYIVGKSFGKNKLYEKISPKKTVEGFIGGLFFSMIAGFLISKFLIMPSDSFSQTSIMIWTIIALIVGIMGTLGDLVESKFKRMAGVKDSGKIMPGHGGVLDRLDSVIFVAPIIFLFYKILNYVS